MNMQPNFGNHTPAVDYAQVAASLRNMQPRALKPDQLDDVFTMIEWLREDTLRQVTELDARTKAFAQQEKLHQENTRALAHRLRAVNLIVAPRKGWFRHIK